MRPKVLVITGSMGSGKSTVLAEASDLLAADGIVHAALDLDAVGIAHVPKEARIDLPYRNLAAIWENYAAIGVARLLLAEAVESRAELDRIQAAIPGSAIVVCRLRARLETMQQRVSLREPGMLRETLIARVAELEALLDRAQLEDFALTNDDGSITDVARELLVRAGWM
jgi:ABC-type uncharacterized transport system YnjBCD ATPase subunit